MAAKKKKKGRKKSVVKKAAVVAATGYAWRLNSVGRAASSAAQIRTVRKDYGRVKRGAAKTTLAAANTKVGQKVVKKAAPHVSKVASKVKSLPRKAAGKGLVGANTAKNATQSATRTVRDAAGKRYMAKGYGATKGRTLVPGRAKMAKNAAKAGYESGKSQFRGPALKARGFGTGKAVGRAAGAISRNKGKTALVIGGAAVVAGGAAYAYKRRKNAQATTYKRRLKSGKVITVRKSRTRKGGK